MTAYCKYVILCVKRGVRGGRDDLPHSTGRFLVVRLREEAGADKCHGADGREKL